MFKRIATSTLIVGALMSIVPSLASAQDFYRGRERERYERRVRHERFRGYYDRFGCWHRY
jgi:hypothetical protein